MSETRPGTRWLLLALAALFVAGALALAWRSQRTLELGLPPRVACLSPADGLAKAQAWSLAHGGFVFGVLGTGSMAPFIPAGDPTALGA